MVQARVDLPTFGGQNFHGVHVFQLTIDPPSIPAQTTQEVAVIVPQMPTPFPWGAQLDPVVLVNKQNATPAGLGIVGVRYVDTVTIAIAFMNVTALAIDAGPQVYNIAVIW